MFDPSEKPRVFAAPPGADFPAVLVEGLRARFAGKPPEAMARVHLIVNTRRMERRIRTLFDQGPPALLPRISLLSDIATHAVAADIPPAVSPLRKRFELTQLISQLLDRQPDLAARATLYDLADSLATLMDEMAGEGVTPDVIEGLDVSDQSGHWERAKAFFSIARHFLEDVDKRPDTDTRQRRIVEAMAAEWAKAPPDHPIILAGSTGSRGTTMLLMQAIAGLPQGAIVLPGFDFDMPEPVWDTLDEALHSEDHPQYRFRHLMNTLGVAPSEVDHWHPVAAPCPLRNALVSLALRPAPVTDQWLREGPKLGNLPDATEAITLIEAPSVRDEALAIALRMRKAAEDGETAALITPDRMLTRQVEAALDRWNIIADDSAGSPLQLSPPGRFLRHVSTLFQRKLTAESLLTLLKHPLCHSGENRNTHLLNTRELELAIRRKGMTFPTPEVLRQWQVAQEFVPSAWVEWVISNFCDKVWDGKKTLSDRLEAHVALAENLTRGSAEGSGGLWDEAAGRKAAATIAQLRENAKFAGDMSAADYADLFGAIFAREEVRDRDSGHPNILIWGTLEARVQGANLVILGGLNEGSWPAAPTPDPWLNRKMRHDAGLLLPERRIGLSAHDFQQAIAAPEVWITRSVRSDEAETVPSRWINRLTNLLSGLPDQGGVQSLKEMKARGTHWMGLVSAIEAVKEIPPSARPSPRPPAQARPKRLSVTQIKRLIRDPYAIYARETLRLRPLDSLMKTPDALLRGIIVHEILEQFVSDIDKDMSLLSRDHLMSISETVLAKNVPWPAAKALWSARLDRVSDRFVASEAQRREHSRPIAYECGAKLTVPELDFTLVAKADRIDRTEDGDLIIYDYKTGKPPSQKDQRYFDKQLLLEAAMAEQGGFRDIDPAEVADAIYIGLGPSPKDEHAPMLDAPALEVWAEFLQLIAHYGDPSNGFTARRAMQSDRDVGDYDQLARFGEWDATDEPLPEDLT
ncbi:double-strand break repair protein AddB [Shimia gijangensis]|uniref:Double-strand break repair protein AddB n=1 Tax=Shimia gijangensis TaxID=1470563 RepID=A0A1M6MU50_9RHOB|nr:double-strand break repair protein AddB [Shimia gijangensis]SHJ86793.1 double-strand break repair protein AddB [Shimia gijangensis]